MESTMSAPRCRSSLPSCVQRLPASLEGTSKGSLDAAPYGLMSRLAALIVADNGPASPGVCRRWLPSWLPNFR
jgi:hypothetical protein